MIVLARREGQWLRVSGPCRVYVVAVKGGRVRIGIRPLEGGDDVHVLRGELEPPPTTPAQRFDDGVFDS
jgi:sRNA-binding carbon storage regulator CsrA